MLVNFTQTSLTTFRAAYAAALVEVQSYWTEGMQREVARHCQPWGPGNFDFMTYLRASRVRYEHAIDLLGGVGRLGSLCDVGGFLGLFPLALAKLGINVALTEAFKYYSTAFTPLFDMLARHGVEIIDYDPFEAEADTLTGRFSAITVMAVLEHYPHSPALFMRHVTAMMTPGAYIVIEVPNIAFWPKRIALLRGKSPLVPLTAKLASQVPFIGHHHEYSRDDLYALIRHAGLRPLDFRSFNYSLEAPLFNRLVTEPSLTIASWLLPNARECLAVVATAAGGPQ